MKCPRCQAESPDGARFCEDCGARLAGLGRGVDSLIESLPGARLLLLVNYRPEYSHGWGSKTYYTQLRIDPLSSEDAGTLLGALLGDDAAVAPLKQLLIERTEGNPFFLEESVRTLVETGVLAGERGAYRLAKTLQAGAAATARGPGARNG